MIKKIFPIFLFSFFLFSFAMPKWKRVCSKRFDTGSQIVINTEKERDVFFVLNKDKKLSIFEEDFEACSDFQVGYEKLLGVEFDEDGFWSVYAVPIIYDDKCPLLNIKMSDDFKSIYRTLCWSIDKMTLDQFKCQNSLNIATIQKDINEVLSRLGIQDNINLIQKVFYKISDEDEYQYQSVFALIRDLDNGYFICKWVN